MKAPFHGCCKNTPGVFTRLASLKFRRAVIARPFLFFHNVAADGGNVAAQFPDDFRQACQLVFHTHQQKPAQHHGKAEIYNEAENLSQPDFILLYMPIENSVGMIYSDNDFREIIQSANSSNIIIVGSASLLTVVRLVNQLWAIQSQFENSNKIAEAGAKLYDTFEVFCESLMDIQKKFNEVSGLFTKTINRFKRNSPKNPSLFSQVELLKNEYKVNTLKQIPQEFLSEEEISGCVPEEGVEEI